MRHRLKLILIAPVVALLGVLGFVSRSATPAPLDMIAYEALYADPAPAPSGPRKVFHLGHSLVGRDMPAMLAQLAPAGHDYATQLGWGATLRSHWEPDVPIGGFETENAHLAYRDAHDAVTSGEYDALVLTEMANIKDAVRYHNSPKMLHNWATLARNSTKAGQEKAQIYLYVTWPPRVEPKDWLNQLEHDLKLLWEDLFMRPALAYDNPPQPIFIIPGGQVMAEFTRSIEARGGFEAFDMGAGLFDDHIHFNDYGAYLMALTHYAVLYQKSPLGLPHALMRADGTPAANVGAEVAALMQDIVWRVVTNMSETGVPPQR